MFSTFFSPNESVFFITVFLTKIQDAKPALQMKFRKNLFDDRTVQKKREQKYLEKIDT